jgi:hypothetical protein
LDLLCHLFSKSGIRPERSGVGLADGLLVQGDRVKRQHVITNVIFGVIETISG